MITLYGFPKTRSLRVSWMLEELGLDWDSFPVDFSKGTHRSDEFLAVNPCGKVPALKDGDLVMLESAGICLHLAEKYGKGQFLPEPGTDASAKHHQWISYIICELEQHLWAIGRHKFALPKERRIAEMLDTAAWEFARGVQLAEKWIPEEGYLLGDQFTVADLLLTHTLNWAHGFNQPLPPKAEAFRLRVGARPALKAGLKKEFAGTETHG